MILSEKAAYVKGLIDGSDINTETKEGKILLAIYDLISDIANTVDEIDADVDDIVEFCNVLDTDLQTVEDYLLDEEDDDEDDDDCDCCDCDCDFDCDCCNCEEDGIECVCPTCGDTIELTEPMLEEGSINCPNCGELLEFDIEEECDCDDCCDDECECDGDVYTCQCPTCGDIIELTIEMIEEGSINCPGCGELLEFDVEEEDCDCDCEEE